MVAQVWTHQIRWLVPAIVFALFPAYAVTQTLPSQLKTYTGSNDYMRDPGFDAHHYYASLFPNRKAYWLPLANPPEEGVGPRP